MQRIRIALSIIIICLSVFVSTPAQQQTAPAQATAAQAAKPLEHMVAMRDGVKLATGVYLPEGSGPWPVVLIRTPYGKQTQAGANARWTGRGFALVVQDCRGTGKSEGERDDHGSKAQEQHRGMYHHPVVLQQRVQPVTIRDPFQVIGHAHPGQINVLLRLS